MGEPADPVDATASRGTPRPKGIGSSGFNRKLLAPMILGSILNPINSSLLAVALIPIGAAFGAPPSQTAWLVSALYLATGVGQPVVGRLVEIVGPRPVYLVGTALVGVGGIVGALAPQFGYLVVARVILGIGTSAGYPAAMYLIRAETARTRRDSPATILSLLSIANQSITVVGPVLGGALIGLGGWHTIFWVNVPLAAACLILGPMRLPRGRLVTSGSSTGAPPALDATGMALFAGMLIAFMLFLMDLRPGTWYLAATAVVFGAAFVWRELRAHQPFIDVRVLRGNGPLLLTFIRQALTYTIFYSFLYGFAQWLQSDRGLTPESAGLMSVPMSLAAIVVTAWTGRRREIRGKLVVCAVVQVVVCAAMLALGTTTPIWALLVVSLLFGIPQGLGGLANQNALYYQSEPARTGSSAGLLRTFMYLGAMFSSAAIAVCFGDDATTAGLHRLAWVLLGCAVALAVIVLVDRSLGRYGHEAATV